MEKNNLGKYVYLVGIKGAGMAGLAQLLKGIGYRVEGSDIADSFFTDEVLKQQGIPFYHSFDPKRLKPAIDWVVASSAYLDKAKNVEIEALQKRNVPILTYAQALGLFFNQAYGIAVTGTHGKSTVAGMIAYILEQTGKDPFALVGGELLNWHSNARVPLHIFKFQIPNSQFFVIEADEYREQFLHYKPRMLVITNIDYDHPDYFKTKKHYQRAFERFKDQVKPKGLIIEKSGTFTPQVSGLTLRLIGKHNKENAALAYEVCKRLGVSHENIIKALKNFKGLRRRLETIGAYKGAAIIDDYAHHPAEIRASLEALRGEFRDKKLLVLFHPHTYSRTKAFLKEFAKALTLADAVYLLDIYASARENKGDVSSDNIVEAIQGLGYDALNLHTIKNAIQYFQTTLKKGDVLVTMGAGDVFRVAWSLVRLPQ